MITLHRIERLFSDHQHRRLYRELISARPEATLGLEPRLAKVIPLAALGMIRLEELSQAQTSLYQRLMNVVLTAQHPGGGWGDPMTTAIALRALLSNGGHGPAVDNALACLGHQQTESGLWSASSECWKMPGNASFSRMAKAQNEPNSGRMRLARPWRPASTKLPENARLCSFDEKAKNEPTDAKLRLTHDIDGNATNEAAQSAAQPLSDAFVTAFILLQLGDRDLFRRAVRFDEAVATMTHQANRLEPGDRRLWNHAVIRCRTSAFDKTRGRFLWPAA